MRHIATYEYVLEQKVTILIVIVTVSFAYLTSCIFLSLSLPVYLPLIYPLLLSSLSLSLSLYLPLNIACMASPLSPHACLDIHSLQLPPPLLLVFFDRNAPHDLPLVLSYPEASVRMLRLKVPAVSGSGFRHDPHSSEGEGDHQCC